VIFLYWIRIRHRLHPSIFVCERKFTFLSSFRIFCTCFCVPDPDPATECFLSIRKILFLHVRTGSGSGAVTTLAFSKKIRHLELFRFICSLNRFILFPYRRMKELSSAPKASSSSSSWVLVASTSSAKMVGTGPFTGPSPSKKSMLRAQDLWVTMATLSCLRMGLDSTVAFGAGRDCSCSSR
jgi:hypothetical protein